jgi:arylsulfatase A-like enzyme
VQRGLRRYTLYGTRPANAAGDPYDAGDLKKVQSGLQALRDLATQDKPWCLFIGTDGPHDPFVMPEHYACMYDPASVPLPPSFHDNLLDKPRIYGRMRQFWEQFSEDEYREAIAHYWGYCTMVDDFLGMTLDALDQTGQAENTLVIFMSDHGEAAGAHGLFMKGFAAIEECYRIPCIMRWPRGIAQPGRVLDDFVTLADFAPTLAELAGTVMPPCSGRSLLPLLRGETGTNWPDEVCSQFNGIELYYSQRFVRTREWMYVYNGSDMDELYDLRNDPHCLRNLADDVRHQPVLQDMCARLWRKAQAESDRMLYTMSVAPPFGPQRTT